MKVPPPNFLEWVRLHDAGIRTKADQQNEFQLIKSWTAEDLRTASDYMDRRAERRRTEAEFLAEVGRLVHGYDAATVEDLPPEVFARVMSRAKELGLETVKVALQ